ncbi:MAG: hypothetical protein WC467_01005 [Patescibacteria group bacterium]
MTKEDWIRLGTAILVATVAFWFFYLLLYFVVAPSWAFWLIVSIAFASCLLVLSAVDAAVITKSGLGTAIVLFMFLQAGLLTVWHYSHVIKDNKARTEKTEQNDKIRHVNSTESGALILLNSSKVFNLKDGEETLFIGAPEGTRASFTWSSPTYNFEVFGSDGSHCFGMDKIPEKAHVYYKIKANSDQLVTVTVEEITP